MNISKNQTHHQNHMQTQALFSQALTAQDKNLLELATSIYKTVIQQDPKHLEAHFNLAVIHHDQNNLEKALSYYQKAVTIQPDLAPAHKNIGDIQFILHEFDAAAAAYKKSLQIDSKQAATWNNLGLLENQRRNYDNAAKAWLRALKLQPGHIGAGHSLTPLLRQQGKYEDALAINRKLLQIHPEDRDSQFEIALTHQILGALETAARSCSSILKQNPDDHEALNILGLIYLQRGEPEQAISTLRLALKKQHDLPNTHSNLLYAMLMDPLTTPSDYLQEARDWWQKHGLSSSQKSNYYHLRQPPQNRKLRLGFISADFRRHSVSYFLLPLLKGLEKSQFKIYGYADLAKIDDYSLLIQQQMDIWHPIFGLDNHTVGRLIEDDEIDILIDLGGHTANNRLVLMAQKPAPVQISWLGYPASSGLANGTFRLSDRHTDPISSKTFYSEPLIQMPNRFLCYAPPPEAIALVRKSGKRPLTFGSFNNSSKINSQVVSSWAKILQQTTGSRLLLKAKVFSDQKTRDIFQQRFAESGLDPDRIEFRPGNPHLIDHFNSYNDIDIALDTFPYNGTTTTCEALWMGVPVITLQGTTHAARVGSDLMDAIGCPELIAENQNDYIQIASALAGNPKRQLHYHKSMRSYLRNSPLMNAGDFAAEFATTITDCWMRWWKSKPLPTVNAAIDRARALSQQEELEKAQIILQKTIDYHPENAELYYQLANILHRQRQPQTALKALNSCLSLNPRDARALSNLGYLMQNQGKHSEAAKTFKQALEIDPEQPETVANLFWYMLTDCQWREAEIWEKKLDYLNYMAFKKNKPPVSKMFLHISRNEDETINCKFAQAQARSIRSQITPFKHTPLKESAKLLKIAYLSGDFRDHAVAHNLLNLFRLHDRSQFHVSAYSCGADDDSIYRRRIENDCDRFINIQNVPDYEAANLIKNDNIDILIELMGHTRDNRLRLCAFKPAPVQISYLGYPSTTGADFIDYMIADRIVIPPEHQEFYSEEIIYLPNCFMIADRAPIAPLPSRQACGLPTDAFIFCSFNSAYKIEPVMFDIWMKILKQLPNAILWLRGGSTTMENNLRNEASNRAIDPKRLIFAAKVPEKKDHLARLQLADIGLDTRIYNGHTTTLDALWAGVPVITLKGRHFASRVSSSNLENIGLPGLITTDIENYQKLAVELGRQPETLKKFKETLSINRKTEPLFDTEAITRNLEAAYQEVWERYTHGQPAKSITSKP